VTLAAYVTVLVTYYISSNKLRTRETNVFKFLTEKLNLTQNKTVYRFGLFFLVVGGGAVVFFIINMGGYKNAIGLSQVLRDARTDSSLYYGPFTALARTVSVWVLGAPYCFYVYNRSEKYKKKRLLFWISFALSIVFLIFNLGRAPILFFLAPFLIDFLMRKRVNIPIALIVMFIIVALTSQLYRSVLYQMTTGTISINRNNTSIMNNVLDTASDLSYPYANLTLSSDMNETYGYRYGIDYFLWAVEILPIRIFQLVGIEIPRLDNTMNRNTTAYHYSLIPPERVYYFGGVPTDLITLGMRQFNVIGVIFNCFLFSLLSAYIYHTASSISSIYNLLIIRVNMMFFTFVSNNDLTDMVRGSLFLFIIAFMLFKIKKNASSLNTYNYKNQLPAPAPQLYMQTLKENNNAKQE